MQSLCYGTLRWYHRLDVILAHLLKKPLRDKDADIRILALVGLYQLAYSRVKPHAAVAETVNATPKLWAKPLINALLRNYQREKEAVDSLADRNKQGLTSHPDWLLSEFIDSWSSRSETIVAGNNEQPPLVLRVNRLKCTRKKYLAMLAEDGINAIALKTSESAVQLSRPIEIKKLPGFYEGMVSVQDGAAQLAATLLDLKQGHNVLDACAAPGGKTTHILETCPQVDQLVAVDISPERSERIQANLQRLELKATIVTADITKPLRWWQGELFDRILLDAPCSSTGVIRRHPDIKVLRRAEDISAVIRIQRQILETTWSSLAPNGILLYATCSVLRQENDKQIQNFLAGHQDAREWPINGTWGVEGLCGRQILTGEQGMDGFFYARLIKAV